MPHEILPVMDPFYTFPSSLSLVVFNLLLYHRITRLSFTLFRFSRDQSFNSAVHPFPGCSSEGQRVESQQQWQDWSIAPPEIAFLSLMVQILSVMGWTSHLAPAWRCPLLPYYPYPPPSPPPPPPSPPPPLLPYPPPPSPKTHYGANMSRATNKLKVANNEIWS